MTLAEIASLLGLESPPEGQRRITGVAELDRAGSDEIAYLGSEGYLRVFEKTRAAAVIVDKRVRLPRELPAPVLVVDDVELAMVTVLSRLAPPVGGPPVGIDASARVAPTAEIEPGVAVGPNVVIGERTCIGRGSVLEAGVIVGDDVSIGRDCRFFGNVVIRERVSVGDRVIVHAGSVIGSDGFGYRWDGERHVKVPQIGTVVIEDDVEIGSCVCIDRAKFSETRVGRGTKIDNLVQIAHNVRIGAHCIIVGQSGLAGSVTLGQGVVLGGQSAVRDHITIDDGAMAAACSAIADDVKPKTVVSGMPALPHRQNLREQAALRRLPDLVVQVRKLQDELERLRKNFSVTDDKS